MSFLFGGAVIDVVLESLEVDEGGFFGEEVDDWGASLGGLEAGDIFAEHVAEVFLGDLGAVEHCG